MHSILTFRDNKRCILYARYPADSKNCLVLLFSAVVGSSGPLLTQSFFSDVFAHPGAVRGHRGARCVPELAQSVISRLWLNFGHSCNTTTVGWVAHTFATNSHRLLIQDMSSRGRGDQVEAPTFNFNKLHGRRVLTPHGPTRRL